MAKEIWEAPLTRDDKLVALRELYREVRETGESHGDIQQMIDALEMGAPLPSAVADADSAIDITPARPPTDGLWDDDPEPESSERQLPQYPQDPDKGEQWVRWVFEEVFPAVLPGYEARKPQVDLAVAIARCLSTGEHLVSEAGTGTGKSLAYLVPSIWFARQAGRPVVVTTGTIALQEQITTKDIPFLKKTLDEEPFQAALVKGKGNYLCKQRLEEELAQPTLFDDPEFTRVREWARTTATGDKAEMTHIPVPEVWNRVNVDDTCNKRECPYYRECHFFDAKRKWTEADILVCNHHLYFADLAIRGATDHAAGVLPQYSSVVFDEAHHIEPIASDSFGTEISPFRIPVLMRDIRRLRHPDTPEQLMRDLEDAARFTFEQLLRVEPEITKTAISRLPEEVQTQLSSQLMVLKAMLISLDEELTKLNWTHADEKSRQKCQAYQKRIGTICEEVEQLLGQNDAYVNWVAVERPQGKPPRPSINRNPITVGPLLQAAIWIPTWSAICTSATISTGGNFRYFRTQTGMDGIDKPVRELLVDSPFDYRTQARLYVPRGLPEPRQGNEEQFQAAIIPEIREVLQLTGGRAFVLFTSYRGLQAAHQALADELTAAGMVVFKQGDMPRTQLITAFKETHQSGKSPVLFATGTFWEGIDIQGAALSCVIIDRIPFARPDDPVTLAKLDAIKARGGNEFMEYSVPEAAIKLKQGVGRLIRTRSDRGLVAILDPRLRTKPYGRVFLNSLPPMPEVAYLDPIIADFIRGNG